MVAAARPARGRALPLIAAGRLGQSLSAKLTRRPRGKGTETRRERSQLAAHFQVSQPRPALSTPPEVPRPRKCDGRTPVYQLPYLPMSPRHSASRSRAKVSLPTLAFLAAAVTTITSLRPGSTKIDCPYTPSRANLRFSPGYSQNW